MGKKKTKKKQKKKQKKTKKKRKKNANRCFGTETLLMGTELLHLHVRMLCWRVGLRPALCCCPGLVL
jgi:hypothetical protein